MNNKLLLLIVAAVIVMWLLMGGKYSEYFGSVDGNTTNTNILQEYEQVKRDLDACRANTFVLMTQTRAIAEELGKERAAKQNDYTTDEIVDDLADATAHDTEEVSQ